MDPPPPEPVSIPARDGSPLEGALFRPVSGTDRMVVINGATGVRKGFYRHFGYFRPGARALWTEAIDWLEAMGEEAFDVLVVDLGLPHSEGPGRSAGSPKRRRASHWSSSPG